MCSDTAAITGCQTWLFKWSCKQHTPISESRVGLLKNSSPVISTGTQIYLSFLHVSKHWRKSNLVSFDCASNQPTENGAYWIDTRYTCCVCKNNINNLAFISTTPVLMVLQYHQYWSQILVKFFKHIDIQHDNDPPHHWKKSLHL